MLSIVMLLPLRPGACTRSKSRWGDTEVLVEWILVVDFDIVLCKV